MKFLSFLLVFLVLMVTILVGCNSNNLNLEEVVLKQLRSFYPEDIYRVDRMKMLNSAGERKEIVDQLRIKEWLDQVGEVNVTVNPNREEHSGSLFIVTLLEGEEEKFRLTPTSVNRKKIDTNSELADHMRQLWDE